MKKNIKFSLIAFGIVMLCSFNGIAQAVTIPKPISQIPTSVLSANSASSAVSITSATTLYVETDSVQLNTCYVLITKTSSSSETSSISCLPDHIAADSIHS